MQLKVPVKRSILGTTITLFRWNIEEKLRSLLPGAKWMRMDFSDMSIQLTLSVSDFTSLYIISADYFYNSS